MSMKTTFDIPEPLVREIKRIARERGVTARAIVQQALTRVVEESSTEHRFTLPDASVAGWAGMEHGVRERVERDGGLHDLVLQSYER
jgi:metal-responsive CopG/Arc/MetJ family transcriptional regulator